MKLYKRFKRMGKSTKVGLATSAVYAAVSLALPAFADVERPVQPVFQPVDVSQIITAEQAETVYKEKLAGYAADKFLSFTELEGLSKIQGAKVELLRKENPGLETEYEKGLEPVKKLDEKIEQVEGKLKNIYWGNVRVSPLSEIREQFEKTILNYYPALVDKDNGNITYSAEAKVKPKLVTPFKAMVVEADKILKEHYEEFSLELLVNEDEYTINDVLTLYTTLTKERNNDIYGKKIAKELEDKLAQLKKEKVGIINSEQVVSLKSRIDSFNAEIGKNSYFIKAFEKYAKLKKAVESFESKYGNFNDYFSLSLCKLGSLSNKLGYSDNSLDTLARYARDFKNTQKSSVYSFKKFAKAEGLEVEIETFKNPAKTILPWWLGLLLGGCVPLIRNVVVKSYVKGEDASSGEYVLSGGVGAICGIIGGFAFDGLHPLVFPIRMLTPFAFQPIFRLLKIDPCKGVVDFIREF